jgi:hypothetical protein
VVGLVAFGVYVRIYANMDVRSAGMQCAVWSENCIRASVASAAWLQALREVEHARAQILLSHFPQH